MDSLFLCFLCVQSNAMKSDGNFLLFIFRFVILKQHFTYLTMFSHIIVLKFLHFPKLKSISSSQHLLYNLKITLIFLLNSVWLLTQHNHKTSCLLCYYYPNIIWLAFYKCCSASRCLLVLSVSEKLSSINVKSMSHTYFAFHVEVFSQQIFAEYLQYASHCAQYFGGYKDVSAAILIQQYFKCIIDKWPKASLIIAWICSS